MKLVFKQELRKMNKDAVIYDEAGTEAFGVAAHTGIHHKRNVTCVTDGRTSLVEKATIGHRHFIELDGSKYEIRREKMLHSKYYVVEGLDWKLSFPHSCSEFSVTDVHNVTIAELGADDNAIFGLGTFTMTASDGFDALLVASAYVAISDIIIEEDSIVVSSVFV